MQNNISKLLKLKFLNLKGSEKPRSILIPQDFLFDVPGVTHLVTKCPSFSPFKFFIFKDQTVYDYLF